MASYDWSTNNICCALADQVFIRWWGWIYVSQSANWTFEAGSDDGVELYIDGKRLPTASEWADRAYTTGSDTIYLTQGFHVIRLEYYEAGGDAKITLRWANADAGEALNYIPASNLYYPISGRFHKLWGPQRLISGTTPAPLKYHGDGYVFILEGERDCYSNVCDYTYENEIVNQIVGDDGSVIPLKDFLNRYVHSSTGKEPTRRFKLIFLIPVNIGSDAWGDINNFQFHIDDVKLSINYTYEDPTPPVVSITGAPASWTNQTANADISCSDDSGCSSKYNYLMISDSNPGNCQIGFSDNFESFDATKWGLYSDALYQSLGAVRLTRNENNVWGGLEYLPGISDTQWSAEFKVRWELGSSNPADEIDLLFYASKIDHPWSSASDFYGYRLQLDHYNNDIEVFRISGGTHTSLYNVTYPWCEDCTNVVRVEYDNGSVKIYVNNSLQLDYTISTPDYTYSKFGFSSRTGGENAIHWVYDIHAYSTPTPQNITSHKWVCGAARDSLGNVGFSSPVEFKVDQVAPVTGVSGAPTNWTNISATATVTCSDGDSGCNSSSYRYHISISEIASCPTDLGLYTLGSSATIDSHSWVCSYAQDLAGNQDFSDPVEFRVDQISPWAGDLGRNISDPLINQIIELWLNASDNIQVSEAKFEIKYPNSSLIQLNGSLKNGSSSNGYWNASFQTDLSGIYNITRIWATDLAGNTYISIINHEFRIEEIISTNLVPGKNMFSLPLNESQSITAHQLCSQNPGLAQISRLDRSTKRWFSHVCGIAANDFTLKLGEGYWVKSNSDISLSRRGIRIQNLTQDLIKGWNLISFKEPTDAEGICSSINQSCGSSCTEYVVRLNKSSQSYESHPCGTLANNFNVELGDGYWVRVNRDITWIA